MSKATVSPNIKFLVKPQLKTNSVTKLLKSIFIFAQIVLALDYGFIETKYITKRMMKFITLLQGLIFIMCGLCSLIFATKHMGNWYFVNMVIYIMFVIVTISHKYTYFDFQTDLLAFDKEINAESSSYRFELKLITFSLTIISFISLHWILRYVHATEEIKINTLCDFAWCSIFVLGADFVRITYVFVFCSTYWRISEFIKFVSNDYFDMVSCQYLYKNIVDITEKAKANYNFVFLVTLIFNTVGVTVIIFIPFADNSVKTRPPMRLLTEIMLVTKNIFIMFAPTFTAGLLSAKVEKLVFVLRDKILVAKEEKLRKDIRRFISYIEARPMKFTIFNVIPLDWNLPIIVINLAITYLIVMIQFNYKY